MAGVTKRSPKRGLGRPTDHPGKIAIGNVNPGLAPGISGPYGIWYLRDLYGSPDS